MTRAIVMGEAPPPGHDEKFSYTPLAALSNVPTSLFLDLTHNFKALGVEAAAEPQHPTPQIPAPRSPYPPGSEDFFYTTAQLKHTCQLSLCRFGQYITGIVLHYEDGNSASLGSVNLNHLSKRYPARTAFWVLVERNELKFPRVIKILLEPPVSDTERYLRVSLQGSLDWWFSWRQCQLYYDGTSTIPTRR